MRKCDRNCAIYQRVYMVLNSDGLIETIGYDKEIERIYSDEHFDVIYDATDKCVLPG